MVRETRHLWVGNLPDNIREDRIREHFKRYGRVQNVKLLGRAESASAGVGGTGASGVCATVAFMDIKSASKANNAEHVLDERTLTTEYYEPAAIPPAAGAPSAGSSPAGSGYSGSSSSVNSVPAPSSVSRYHLSGGEDSSGATTCPLAASAAAPATWRGTNDSATEYCRRGNTPAAYGRYQRNNSTAPYSTPPSNLERTTPHHRWYATGATGGESTPSTPGGGTESGRRRRHSGSASSRSDSSSPEPSDTSRASTPATQPPLSSHHNNHRTPPAVSHQWASTANGRPLSICVRNLPTRSTDSSLKDGLYHEYKKHGKVVWVKVVGQNADRYAVVRFKKPSDVEKALEVSQDKLFFGCKISVAPHQTCDDDADSTKPYETDIDEYHPKATRTLFIGNLEKDVTQQQLRDKFKHFGRIIEIDIKKGSGGGAGYAFCQYASISSVVEAIRAMDGEYVGGSRVKLGFGKPVATACVWVDGLTEHTEKQVLGAVSRCGAATSVCVDRAAGAALVHFEQAAAAGAAVRELRRVAAAASAAEPDHPRLCVDYASRECQDAFYEQLEKHGGSAALAGSERLSGELSTRYVPSTRHDSIRFEGCGSRSRASSYGRSSSRTPRYSALEHYDPVDYAADRRYRVYDETGASPPLEDVPFEDRLQSVVVSPHRARRHRRDSTPEDRKHSKERHRSVGGGARRSRSGSAGRDRHAARRKHRRRHDGSCSRAGTPLRDEPDAPPAEPRRPPRDRPPLPMCLPLPKFAAQLLRAAPPTPRPAPLPAPAPDSPPRPPSVSSSSGGSAPHSPSLEERIRSLDEKYEKWSGSRAVTEAPDRARLRHRLLEVDINEVKPSEVVSALLAKRSVFDEDSERLECVVRAPSPSESRGRVTVPRVPRYPPLPTHPPPPPSAASHHPSSDADASDRPSDPRLNRPERPCRLEKLGKINESDYGERRPRPRTPSTDRSQPDFCDRRSPPTLLDGDVESRSRDSATGTCDAESKSSFDTDDKEIGLRIKRERSNSSTSDSLLTGKSESVSAIPLSQNASDRIEENKRSDGSQPFQSEQKCALDVIEMILKKVEHGQKLEHQLDKSCKTTSESKFDFFKQGEPSLSLDTEIKMAMCEKPKKSENNKIQLFNPSLTNSDAVEYEIQVHNKNISTLLKNNKEKDISELNKCSDKIDKDRYNHNISQVYQVTKLEKENIQIEKHLEKEKQTCNIHLSAEKKHSESDKNVEDRVMRNDRDNKVKHNKERSIKDKHDSEKDKFKNNRNEKNLEKCEKDRKLKEDNSLQRNHMDKVDKSKVEKDTDKPHKEKTESDKLKHIEERSRHDHHKKDKSEKDKRKEIEVDVIHSKSKKDDRHKLDKPKKDTDARRENKKESEPIKSRKSSRDESSREICRKDSTDSTTSRASHESTKSKDLDSHDVKEEMKPRIKLTDMFFKLENERESKDIKLESSMKIKHEIKEEKFVTDSLKLHDVVSEPSIKPKAEVIEKHRHHSLDSPSVDSKRKERLNSCSSLPSNIGHKRRISSHDSFDLVCDEAKKNKNDSKLLERRDSKDSKSGDKHKSTKFSKGHFAKIIESKTKDDKKGQVKPPDEVITEFKDSNKGVKKLLKEDNCESISNENGEEAHNNLDFLALFELRSSEEDERQKALRKEMKEKKRIQQLQQIQELQMQQDAMQQGELMGKLKEDKKQKSEDKKKEIAREKRFSIDRKSREEKNDNGKKKNRKLQSSDTSDSDEPKKHSIFDIIDDGPTYISMYDKVKARSCKNMQKQEEEKRQEKIKAKFSQLKQSRAKREEKKRSSWDEDSDSENEGRGKPQKSSRDNSSDDESVTHSKRQNKIHLSNIEFDENKTEDYFSTPNDDDLRNKLTRKNSRSRIISDSSDNDTSKSKSPNYINDTKKFDMSESESLTTSKNDAVKDLDNQVKKNSIINLFGKSDSDDSKLKSNVENENSYKLPGYKSVCNDLSSESESVTSNRNSEFRRKHKKKPKKHKSMYSDEENKMGHSDSAVADGESRQKITEKQRRHSSKKDKKRERFRESIDTDEGRDDKIKPRKEKKSTDSSIGFDYGTDVISNNTKRDGKMEDIFGPLSDESDKDAIDSQNKSDFSCHDFDSLKDRLNSTDIKLKDKDDVRRKKEKKRKEKRWLREDDNSLDMDAVSKAIEARLFAEPLTDDDNRVRIGALDENMRSENNDNKYLNSNIANELVKLNNKHDKMRRDSREKKKKKKRNKEDRQNRKEQHTFYHMETFEKSENEITEIPILETMTNTMLLDIPLPKDSQVIDDKIEDGKSLAQSPSLPRLTESPPISIQTIHDVELKSGTSSTSTNILGDDNNIYVENKDIEIEQIPMPPPFENIVQDISEVPLPADPEPTNLNVTKSDTFIATLSSDSDFSEDAVRSISAMETEIDKIVEVDTTVEKQIDRVDVHLSKVEKKSEEKPRAIISQEETEDAVAALLGESFGGKINTFSNYEEPENNADHQNDIESTSPSTENIPEEDAEEMRQAVQNLNACEMEMKPDTPVSDNDLLLIDTDTEETDETSPQDSSERISSNVAAPNVSAASNIEPNKPAEESQIQVSISKSSIEPHSTKSHCSETDNKTVDTDVKIQLTRRENVQIITSTATPVITSWTLTNNKTLEPHIINIQPNILSNKDKSESKATHITTNIVQIKTQQSQNVQINNIVKPVLASTRVNAPYQVISQMVRPQTLNVQPPSIKIPEPHILYQKSQGIVISPRMTNDPRLQSPKASPQGDGMTSPRLSTVPVLSSSQNLNSTGMISPNSIHQRSPGQVTVVRVQQPPLSPIQAMHLPPGTRTMVSPNRPNSVLVQTQGSPLHHHNRLPVTPVLTPIPKQINVSTVLQQNKGVGVNTSPLLTQQKIITGDVRKNDLRNNIPENKNDSAKIILSPTNLQHSTNPTVMAQNRLISMQNAVHIGNINSPLHINNKFVINKMSPINEKRENTNQKVSDHGGHTPFVSSPIIHVAGVNHSTPSIIQSGTKSVVCHLQEASNISRGQSANVIHTLSSQRLLTPASISNARQFEVNKVSPSVLSMATIRPSTVLTKLESSIITTTSTSNITNVTPILIKTGATIGTIRINAKSEKDNVKTYVSAVQKEAKSEDKIGKDAVSSVTENDNLNKQNTFALATLQNPSEGSKSKCETDFEELLKDNTNKIIVAKDPETNLKVNVDKTISHLTSNVQKSHDRPVLASTECNFLVKEQDVPTSEQSASESTCFKKEDDSNKELGDINKNDTLKDIPSKETSTTPPINVNQTPKDSIVSEIAQLEQHFTLNSETLINKAYENVSIDKEETSFDFVKINNTDELVIETVNQSESIENQLKTLDENDSWSAKDLNIESVIKKVDSLCNDSLDSFQTNHETKKLENTEEIKPALESSIETKNQVLTNPVLMDTENIETTGESTANSNANFNAFANVSTTKRGGRTMRGKKSGKTQDRVQTRQISKTPRGATSAKRGRGRAKVDKKVKSVVTSNTSTMPGDVYDFHEDSGDEGSSNKTEPRPRLILTIKSPLSGQAGVTATSTLSIAQKDQNKFEERRPSRDEKNEDFVSPSPNTRKSRRLQEKDVHRVVDDVGEEGARNARSAKRKPVRQVTASKPINTNEKMLTADTRKSPRGTKRTRDRSLSDASVDSGEGDSRRDEIAREPKTPRLDEAVIPHVDTTTAPTLRLAPPPASAPASALVSAPASAPTPAPVTAPASAPTSTPATVPVVSSNVITSHVTAPAASPTPTLQAVPPASLQASPAALPQISLAAPTLTSNVGLPPAPIVAPPAALPVALPAPTLAVPAAAPTPITKPPKKMISEISAKLAGTFEAGIQHRLEAEPARAPAAAAPATGEAQAGDTRRAGDSVPCAMLPVGATEAADARVLSPALPHRPPLAQRAAPDRATPLLIRGGEGAGGAGCVAGVRVRALVAGGGGAASLPRGAHHPPPDPPATHHLPHHHHHANVALGAASRITSVPSISPQGQLALSADLVRSPPPAHQQTSPIASGEGMYPHFSQQHFQMYQQHFRATQHDTRATPTPFTRMEAEGSEAPASPLELRRLSARVPRPAHSPSPADRHIMYAVKCGRSPPPAHGGYAARAAGALPPGAAGAAPPGPPHASQVPHEADSLQMLLRRYPVMWQGLLALKNDSAAVQMHFVGGNPGVASETLARPSDLATPLLRIAQRMRLEPMQLDQVHRKMKLENEHCILLALPCGRDHMDVLQQSTNLTAGFITYLQRKTAAGIVNIAPPGHHQAMFTVHIFPSCDFANENLSRIAPDLMHRVSNIAHLLIVIATV